MVVKETALQAQHLLVEAGAVVHLVGGPEKGLHHELVARQGHVDRQIAEFGQADEQTGVRAFKHLDMEPAALHQR